MNKIKNFSFSYKLSYYNISTKWVLLIIPLLLLSFKTGDTKSEYTLSRASYSVFSTDFSLNGFNDLIIGHKTAWGDSNITVSLLNNDQQGYFSIDTTLTFCGYQENIFAIEINEDEYPDIVTFYSDFLSGVADRYIRIYYNIDGTLSNSNDISLNSSSTFSTINHGDINDDSFEDIIVVSNISQFWGILYNDGTGNFSEPEYHYVYDYYPTDIDCGDLNGDGRDDIVICGQKTEVYFSYPGNFQKITLETDDFKDDVILSDFDLDDDLDIVTFVDLYIVNYTRIKIYENIGNNNFDTLDVYDFQPACNTFFISDLNSDTLPDILFHTLDNSAALVFYNESGFVLSEPQFVEIPDYGESYRNGYCADLDGNGYNDIITLRYHYSPMSNNLSILFNDGNGNFVEDPITNNPTSNPELQTSNLCCYPNPFSNETTISFTIEEKGQVQLQVFDLDGKLINTLISKGLQPDKYNIKWNGTDKNGKEVKTGIYFIRLVTGRHNHSCMIIYGK